MTLLMCVSLLLPWSGALVPGGLSLQEERPAASDRKSERNGSEPTVEEIRALLSDLGHRDWRTREAATKRLGKCGKKALPIIQETYFDTKDPEVKHRIERLARDLFERSFHVGIPFLGITFNLTGETGPDTKEKATGFKVGMVHPGTAAEKAGLEADDIIVGFDGRTVDGHTKQGDLPMWIQSCKVGQEVQIEVLRDGKMIKLLAKLGSLRPKSARLGTALKTRAQADLDEKFEGWWKGNFEQPEVREVPDGAQADGD